MLSQIFHQIIIAFFCCSALNALVKVIVRHAMSRNPFGSCDPSVSITVKDADLLLHLPDQELRRIIVVLTVYSGYRQAVAAIFPIIGRSQDQLSHIFRHMIKICRIA